MGAFGGLATFPLEMGGDETSLAKTYNALRGMLGFGGFALDDTGIDGLFLAAYAMGLDAVFSLDERAALQVFPDLSIDLIPSYEEILRIVPEPGATEEDRREAITAAWTKRISAEIPTLNALLKAIDSRFSVLDTVWANSKVTIYGRAFEPYAPGISTSVAFSLGPFGTKGWSDYPMFSTRDEVAVLFDLGVGIAPGLPEQRIMGIGKSLLDEVLPSWVRPNIITSVGLIAGVSPVGYAGVTGS
jgi:hypothetical protein